MPWGRFLEEVTVLKGAAMYARETPLQIVQKEKSDSAFTVLQSHRILCICNKEKFPELTYKVQRRV